MIGHRILAGINLAAFLVTMTACGGGSSSVGGGGGGGTGGGGGGGGGGNVGPTITSLSPTNSMAGVVALGIVNVYGIGFGPYCQVVIDGQPVSTIFVNSGWLEAQVEPSFVLTPASHIFAVQGAGLTSNPLTFVVYAPAQGPLVMQAVPGYLVGDYEADPAAMAVADLYGDGFGDVVLATANGIAILRGSASGMLSPPAFLSGTAPEALAVGDVDGDGSIDIISLPSNNSSTTTLNVLLNDGKGNFHQASTQSFSGIFPGPAFLADLDGDGRPDLVLTVENPAGTGNTIYWLRNLGGGNFAAPATLASTAPDNGFFSIADFNHDGKPDIMYTAVDSTTGADTLHLLLNQGGSFTDLPAKGLNGIVGTVTVIDFNLDGIPDLVVQTVQNSLVVLYSFLGNGDGSFTQVASVQIAPAGYSVYSLVVGDFDNDGFPDLAGTDGETEPSHILYLFGDGQGNFTPQQVVGPQGDLIATGDINGDGIPDVVAADRFNFVSVSLGQSGRDFPSALALSPQVPAAASAGDIDGDGLPDLFLGGDPEAGAPGTVFQNLGNNQFQYAATTDRTSFMLADLTGKGLADLLGYLGSNLVIWPNNGTLDFSATPITLTESTLPPFAVADMDGDGHPDIVSLSQVFYGNGSYQFTSVPTPKDFSAPFVVGDFNGDGRLDTAAGTYCYLNLGNRTFQEVASSLPLVNGGLAVVGDFNGDGKDDVALTIPDVLGVFIWYSRGDGTFYQGPVLNPGQYVGGLAVGDFDGDGRVDIAAGLMWSQQVAILFNQGQGIFSRSFFSSGAFATAIIAADLNRDGKPDLVVSNSPLAYRPPNADVLFHK